MNWFDGLEAFAKVAATKSFMQAARELKTTNSAITKRIQWLENRLESTLFVRTTRKVTLTEVGERFLNRVQSLLNEWHDIQTRLIDEKRDPRGELVVCLPPNFSGLPKFVNLFLSFARAYPNLRLHIRSTAQPIHLINEKVDILIANEKYLIDPRETIGMKLFDFSYSCFCAKSYRKKYPNLKTPLDLKNHPCILYRNDHQWEFLNKSYVVHGVIHADSADVMIAMAKAGLGVIYIPAFMIEKEIQDKTLQPILEKYHGKKDSLWAFYTRHEYKPRKIELFLDFLRRANSVIV